MKDTPSERWMQRIHTYEAKRPDINLFELKIQMINSSMSICTVEDSTQR